MITRIVEPCRYRFRRSGAGGAGRLAGAAAAGADLDFGRQPYHDHVGRACAGRPLDASELTDG